MSRSSLRFAAVLIPFSAALASCSTMTCVDAPPNPKAEASANIGQGSLETELGALLLVKDGQSVCAIRFTQFCRGNDASPATVFTNGAETMTASYQTVFQGNGTFVLSAPDALQRFGDLAIYRTGGIGFHGRPDPRTVTRISCGDMKLLWKPPYGLHYVKATPYGWSSGSTQLMAVSSATLSTVDALDPNLVWYSEFDTRRLYPKTPSKKGAP